MSGILEPCWNEPLGWGFAFALASMLCNTFLFLSPPGQGTLPWLSLLFAVAALIFLVWGLPSAFGVGQGRGAKVRSSVVALISLLLAVAAVLAFFTLRGMPASREAPRVGQKAPEFTVPHTQDQPVSLAELFSASADDPPAKAVLLVFYRGHW